VTYRCAMIILQTKTQCM